MIGALDMVHLPDKVSLDDLLVPLAFSQFYFTDLHSDLLVAYCGVEELSLITSRHRVAVAPTCGVLGFEYCESASANKVWSVSSARVGVFDVVPQSVPAASAGGHPHCRVDVGEVLYEVHQSRDTFRFVDVLSFSAARYGGLVRKR